MPLLGLLFGVVGYWGLFGNKAQAGAVVTQTYYEPITVEPVTLERIDFSFITDFFSNLFSKQETEPATYNDQVYIMAQTVWGEARNEGYKGMQGVANVIMTRVNSSRWPDSPRGVVLQPYQFSVWNEGDPNRSKMQGVTVGDKRFRDALEISEKAYDGRLKDVTGGADHYLNIEFTKQIRGGDLPSWANLDYKTADIGRHTFLRLT